MQIQSGDKLYIVVRGDISAGYQCAQSVHAAFAFASEHGEATYNWMTKSNYIAVLNSKNEKELYNLIARAKEHNIKFSVFREPDINNEITAVALECSDTSKLLCRDFKLALKNM